MQEHGKERLALVPRDPWGIGERCGMYMVCDTYDGYDIFDIFGVGGVGCI